MVGPQLCVTADQCRMADKVGGNLAIDNPLWTDDGLAELLSDLYGDTPYNEWDLSPDLSDDASGWLAQSRPWFTWEGVKEIDGGKHRFFNHSYIFR